MITNKKYPLLGVVVAGGKASRMGYKNKALLTYKGRKLLDYCLESMSLCERTILNSNYPKDNFSAYDISVVPDYKEGYGGPLVGVYSSLIFNEENANIDWIITCPCDSPNLGIDYINNMWNFKEEYGATSDKIFVAEQEGFLEPMFILAHRSILNELYNFLENGNAKLILFYERFGYKKVSFPKNKYKDMFKNLNTLRELNEK